MDHFIGPNITVLMPVHNAERFLNSAIQSILNQTFQNFEFLIINDGSTDGTDEIIKSINDSRIKYIINKKHMGIVATLNKGLHLAKGKFIARMDGDDISISTRLTKQYNFLNAHPDITIVGSNINLINERSEKIGEYRYPENNNQIRSMLLFGSPFAHPSVLFRKEEFLMNNLFYIEEFRHAEDYDLWQRTLSIFKGANLGEFLLDYRISDGQITNRHYKEQQVTDKKIKNNILKAFKLDVKTREYLLLLLQENLEINQANNFSKIMESLLLLFKANEQFLIFDNELIKKQAISKLEQIVIFYTSRSKKLFSLYNKSKLYSWHSMTLKNKIKSIFKQTFLKIR